MTWLSILHQPPLPTKTITQSHPRIALLQTAQYNIGNERSDTQNNSPQIEESKAKQTDTQLQLCTPPWIIRAASLSCSCRPFSACSSPLYAPVAAVLHRHGRCSYCLSCAALAQVAAALVIVPPGPVWLFPAYPHIQPGSFPSIHTSQIYPFTLAIRHSSTLFQLLHTPSFLQAPTSSNFILRRQTLDAGLSL